jgi:hypothetical protein
VHTNAAVLNPSASYQRVCPDGVQIFMTADRVPGDYQEVALLSSKGESSWTDQRQMLNSQRRKAAELGANGLILQGTSEPNPGTEIIGAALGTGATRRGSAVAIHIPGDSLRVRKACGASLTRNSVSEPTPPATPSFGSPAPTPVETVLMDDVPAGTNFVANASTKTYHALGCPVTATIPPVDRLYYKSEASLVSGGFTRGPCDLESPPAQVPSLWSADSTVTSSRMPAAIEAYPPQTEVFAQRPTDDGLPARRGFWFNGGLGWGSLGCDGCDGRTGGLSGIIGLGGTVSQKVYLGVTSTGWTRDEDGVAVTVGTLTGMLRFYPSASGRFYLLGGLGLGSISVDVDGFGTETETGGGALVGLGYDIRLGDNTSLSVYWNGFAASTENADANVGQLGLSITAH